MEAGTGPPHDGSPQSLGPILSAFLRESGLLKPAAKRRLTAAWCEAVGAALAGHTRVVGLRRDVLEVEVDSAARIQELAAFHKGRILARLAQLLDSRYVRDIRFRPGAFGPPGRAAHQEASTWSGPERGRENRSGTRVIEVPDPCSRRHAGGTGGGPDHGGPEWPVRNPSPRARPTTPPTSRS